MRNRIRRWSTFDESMGTGWWNEGSSKMNEKNTKVGDCWRQDSEKAQSWGRVAPWLASVISLNKQGSVRSQSLSGLKVNSARVHQHEWPRQQRLRERKNSSTGKGDEILRNELLTVQLERAFVAFKKGVQKVVRRGTELPNSANFCTMCSSTRMHVTCDGKQEFGFSRLRNV